MCVALRKNMAEDYDAASGGTLAYTDTVTDGPGGATWTWTAAEGRERTLTHSLLIELLVLLLSSSSSS